MNTSELVYLGELRTEATHVFSGNSIFTDAPLDNHGKAQYFSPTDLVATALASCIITTIAIQTKEEGIKLDGSKLAVRKIMTSNPRKIAEIQVDIRVAYSELNEQQKSRLEQIAHNCPVAKSLHPDLVQTITFEYL